MPRRRVQRHDRRDDSALSAILPAVNTHSIVPAFTSRHGAQAMIALDFKTIQRAALAVGIVGTATSITMTSKFGWETSWVHAVGFACVTILAAIIYPARRYIEAMGLMGAVRALTIAAPFLLCLELFGDLGYTIGQRDKSLKGATVQTTNYTEARTSVDEDKAALKTWGERLSALEAQAPWAPVVTADGLRAELASMEGDYIFKRSKGCANVTIPESRAFCDKRAAIQGKIATAEERAKIIGQIESTKKKLDEARGKAAVTQIGHSAAKSQSDFIAKIWLAVTGADAKTTLNPDEMTLGFTEIFIGFFIALGCTVLPTIAFMIAFAGPKNQAMASKVHLATAQNQQGHESVTVEHNEVRNYHYLDLLGAKALTHARVA